MGYQEDRFTEIADAIRSVKGTTESIKATDFAEEIEDTKGCLSLFIRGSTYFMKSTAEFRIVRGGVTVWSGLLGKTPEGDVTSIYDNVIVKIGDIIKINNNPHTYDYLWKADIDYIKFNADGTTENDTYYVPDWIAYIDIPITTLCSKFIYTSQTHVTNPIY